jgi:hypothetical protein
MEAQAYLIGIMIFHDLGLEKVKEEPINVKMSGMREIHVLSRNTDYRVQPSVQLLFRRGNGGF